MRRLRKLPKPPGGMNCSVSVLALSSSRLSKQHSTLLEEDIIPPTVMPGQAGARGAKRLILKRFPYDVVVYEQEDELVAVAFAHQSRRPGYWRHRMRTR